MNDRGTAGGSENRNAATRRGTRAQHVTWPTRQIRLVVPFATGSGMDLTSRSAGA